MRFLVKLLSPKWVVFDEDGGPELGLSILGVVIALYKGEVYYPSVNKSRVRKPGKREFGESLHPNVVGHFLTGNREYK